MLRELPPMLRLAGPVVLAEIGWMSMGLVDTIMVGPLGPAAIGVSGMGNSLLIWGHFGFPAFGIYGSAWATVAARVYLAGFLGLAIVREHRARNDVRTRVPFAFEAARVWTLFALGLPAASQLSLEVGVFAAVSALAGTLDPVSLGAHQIALNIAALSFMVPL